MMQQLQGQNARLRREVEDLRCEIAERVQNYWLRAGSLCKCFKDQSMFATPTKANSTNQESAREKQVLQMLKTIEELKSKNSSQKHSKNVLFQIAIGESQRQEEQGQVTANHVLAKQLQTYKYVLEERNKEHLQLSRKVKQLERRQREHIQELAERVKENTQAARQLDLLNKRIDRLRLSETTLNALLGQKRDKLTLRSNVLLVSLHFVGLIAPDRGTRLPRRIRVLEFSVRQIHLSIILEGRSKRLSVAKQYSVELLLKGIDNVTQLVQQRQMFRLAVQQRNSQNNVLRRQVRELSSKLKQWQSKSTAMKQVNESGKECSKPDQKFQINNLTVGKNTQPVAEVIQEKRFMPVQYMVQSKPLKISFKQGLSQHFSLHKQYKQQTRHQLILKGRRLQLQKQQLCKKLKEAQIRLAYLQNQRLQQRKEQTGAVLPRQFNNLVLNFDKTTFFKQLEQVCQQNLALQSLCGWLSELISRDDTARQTQPLQKQFTPVIQVPLIVQVPLIESAAKPKEQMLLAQPSQVSVGESVNTFKDQIQYLKINQANSTEEFTLKLEGLEHDLRTISKELAGKLAALSDQSANNKCRLEQLSEQICEFSDHGSEELKLEKLRRCKQMLAEAQEIRQLASEVAQQNMQLKQKLNSMQSSYIDLANCSVQFAEQQSASYEQDQPSSVRRKLLFEEGKGGRSKRAREHEQLLAELERQREKRVQAELKLLNMSVNKQQRGDKKLEEELADLAKDYDSLQLKYSSLRKAYVSEHAELQGLRAKTKEQPEPPRGKRLILTVGRK